MASSGDVHSILHKDKNRASQQQNPRLWKGQAPLIQDSDSDDIFENPKPIQKPQEEQQQILPKQEEEKKIQVIEKTLQDIQPVQMKSRAHLLQKLLQKEHSISEQSSSSQDEEDEQQESSNESINQEQSEGYQSEEINQQILKPLFVPQSLRVTQQMTHQDLLLLEEEKQQRIKRTKEEAKMLVLEAIRAKEEVEDQDQGSDGILTDDDSKDQKEQVDQYYKFELWRIRELQRIRQDRKERQKLEELKIEIERRRNLTDEQRMLENKRLGSDATKDEKKVPYRFMQKFYHKGVFFQDSDDPIFHRDYNTAVGEDLWDKSELPKSLQKRRDQFGKKGQTKYTHLTDQDTTNFDPYFKKDETIEHKIFQKMGGQKGQNLEQRLKKQKKF